MSYKDFTLERVRKQFGLAIESNQDLFTGISQPLPLTQEFTNYLAVTTGNQWKFLSLIDQTAYVDRRDYYIDQLETLMGILVSLVQPPLPVVAV